MQNLNKILIRYNKLLYKVIIQIKIKYHNHKCNQKNLVNYYISMKSKLY